jgi:YesN/AraC family two-component response regulator
MVKVSIVEDDKHFREGLVQLINSSSQFRVLHSYPSAEEALKHVAQFPPDIVMVDIKLPAKMALTLSATSK